MSLALLILFVAIQAADVWTTHKGLAVGDNEASPIGSGLLARLGFWRTVLLVKGLGILLAIALTVFVRDAYWFTGLLCVGGAAVLWNNAKVLGETD